MGLRLDMFAAITAVGAAVVLATMRDALGITPGLAGMLMVSTRRRFMSKRFFMIALQDW